MKQLASLAALALAAGLAAPADAALMFQVSDDGVPIPGCATSGGSPLAVACSDANFSAIGIAAQGAPTVPSPDLGTITVSATQTGNAAAHVLDFLITQTGLSAFAGGNSQTTFTYNGLINLPGPVTYHQFFNGVDIADATLGPSAIPQVAGPFDVALGPIPGAFTDAQEIIATFAPAATIRQLQANAQFVAVESVPEPTSLAILGTGLLGLGFIAYRRKRLAWRNSRAAA